MYMCIYICINTYVCAYVRMCVCRSYACPIGMELMKEPVMAAGVSLFRSHLLFLSHSI